ncbi:MAG: cytochrome c oxidase subunit 2A [Gemmatimonadota bacterium]
MTQPPSSPQPTEPPEEEAPVGTLFLLTIFITVLAGMWGALYVLLLNR